MVLLGGISELCTSLFSILAFNKAEEFGVNAGLSGVILPISSAFVAIACYFMNKEKIQIVQGVGMLIVLVGATLIAMFPPHEG